MIQNSEELKKHTFTNGEGDKAKDKLGYPPLQFKFPEYAIVQIRPLFEPEGVNDLEQLKELWSKTLDKVYAVDLKPELFAIVVANQKELAYHSINFKWNTWEDETFLLVKEDIVGWDIALSDLELLNNPARFLYVFVAKDRFDQKRYYEDIEGIYQWIEVEGGMYAIRFPISHILCLEFLPGIPLEVQEEQMTEKEE